MHKLNLPIRTLATLAFLALLGWTNASRPVHQFAREIPGAVDAPFRDGVFHGRLAAERCQLPQAPVGRWSGLAERSRFAEGYTTAFGIARRMNAACAVAPEAALFER